MTMIIRTGGRRVIGSGRASTSDVGGSHGQQQPSLDLLHLADLLGQVHDADLVLDVLLPLGVPRLLGRLVVLLALHHVRLVVLLAEAADLLVGHRPSHLLEVPGRSQAVHVPLPERHEVRLPVDGGDLVRVDRVRRVVRAHRRRRADDPDGAPVHVVVVTAVLLTDAAVTVTEVRARRRRRRRHRLGRQTVRTSAAAAAQAQAVVAGRAHSCRPEIRAENPAEVRMIPAAAQFVYSSEKERECVCVFGNYKTKCER